MKKVYIVNGSEDGIVGVFSSKSKARQRAISYVQAGCKVHLLDPTIQPDATKMVLRPNYFKWSEYFYCTNTRSTAEIIIEELRLC